MPFLEKSKIKLSLAESFTGIIWKVETDDKFPVVALETRDLENKTTSYSAFNYETGLCLFKEVTVPESWLWSIDRVHQEFIFLHSYIHESSPEHKGIIAIGRAGIVEWEQYHTTLYDVAEEGLVIYNPKVQPKSLELIAVTDGTPIQRKLTNYQPVQRDLIVPEWRDYSVELAHLLPDNLHGPIFHTHYNEKDLLVFHTQNGNVFDQQLTVFQNGQLLFKDNLAQNIQKLNPEAFFIERSHLFYIRNDKHDFVSYLV